MKPCHDNNGAVIYVVRAATVSITILCFHVHTTVEYLNRNISLGQVLQQIQNLLWFVHKQSEKMLTETYTIFIRLTTLGTYLILGP